MVNLLDNAIKYSPEDTPVELAASQTDDWIAINITDHGPGIEAEHLPRLFERFYRSDKARSRALGGTGLGLSIVKHVSTVHGGTVDVESKIGHGSTFTIRLPLPGQNEALDDDAQSGAA